MSAADCPCDGTGWRPVTAKYAEGEARLKHDPEKDPRSYEAARASLLNTVYPCKEHNRDMFWRWANGHLDVNHDRASCPECQPIKATGRSMRRGSSSGPQPAGGVEPPPPSDRDLARSEA